MNAQIEEKLKHLPNKPGAYMMKDEHGEIIYVGKAASLRSRVRSYFQNGQAQTAKVLVMMAKVQDVDWLVTDTEIEALMLECNLIKKFRPRYNIRLRDDKHYPYLCVTTSEPFPRVLVVRRVKQDGNRYFGPYADSAAMRGTLSLIRKIFKIRGCNKKLTGNEHDKPCLNLHLGHCEAPCSGRISREEYKSLAADAGLFLEGRQDTLAERLAEEMMKAADELQFERAARFRDQLESVRKVTEKQKVINTDLCDQDVISISSDEGWACVQVLSIRSGKLVGQEQFFLEGVSDETNETGVGEFVKQYYRDAVFVPREVHLSHEPEEMEVLENWLTQKSGHRVKLIVPKRGEKRRLVEMAAENAKLAGERESSQLNIIESLTERDLESLREVLDLPNVPYRIEAYDISNIQGTEAVGSMVVFEGGLPAKTQYRRFKIKTIAQPDDYGMMREVIRRRFASAQEGDAKFSTLPDLMVIDGGRGQLNAAQDAMAEFLYKIPTISLAKRLEEVYRTDTSEPLLLPRDSYALRLLQRIRDEAHRFALAYHHKLREKTSRKSILDSIPGIGAQRRKALIRKFGSVAGVRTASLEELTTVPGITRTVAQAIHEALHNE